MTIDDIRRRHKEADTWCRERCHLAPEMFNKADLYQRLYGTHADRAELLARVNELERRLVTKAHWGAEKERGDAD